MRRTVYGTPAPKAPVICDNHLLAGTPVDFTRIAEFLMIKRATALVLSIFLLTVYVADHACAQGSGSAIPREAARSPQKANVKPPAGVTAGGATTGRTTAGRAKGAPVQLKQANTQRRGQPKQANTQRTGAPRAWIMHSSSNYLGTMTIKVTQSAISIYIDKAEIEGYAAKKDRKVVIMNHRDKIYMAENLEQWQKRMAKYKKSNENEPAGVKVVRGKTSTIAGYKAIELKLVPIDHKGGRSSTRGLIEVWVTPEIASSESEIRKFFGDFFRVMAQVQNVPTEYGALLRMRAEKLGQSRWITVMDTYKIEKSSEELSLKVPKGYKKVEDEVALFWGETGESDLNAMP